MKILMAQLNPTVGDIQGNCREILAALDYARSQSVDLVLFPELAVCGYPPEDLLLLPHFATACQKTNEAIASATQGLTAVIGTIRKNPESTGKSLHNSAAIYQNGELLGYYDKQLLPTYDVFDESRYFEPGSTEPIFDLLGKKIGITICEDIWEHTGLIKETRYKANVIEQLESADLILNLSASPFDAAKTELRKQVCFSTALALNAPVLQCNQVGGNDSLIFSGHSLVTNSQGELLQVAEGFSEDMLIWDSTDEKEAIEWVPDEMEELYQGLVLGLRDYFRKLGIQKGCFGLSGGIDSALVACIAKEALGAKNLLALLMPSRYSSQGSLDDAYALANTLGIETKELSIEGPFAALLELLNPHFEGMKPDVTEENLQARIRGILLMAFSNKFGYVVLSTGNKSEMAMGYSTLYGDMCGGLSVISDLTKEQVYALSSWINRNEEIIPISTIQKPPSAELRPDQKDSDSLPDYAIVDRVLEEYVVEHKPPGVIAEESNIPMELVQSLVQKIHFNEYKRRQAPPGLRVTKKAFSVGRRFPIVQKWISQ